PRPPPTALSPYTTLFRSEQFEQFRRIIDLIDARDSNIEGLYYLYYYLHRIDLHTMRGEFRKSWEWLPELISVVNQNPYNWDQHRDRKSTRLNSSHVKISY